MNKYVSVLKIHFQESLQYFPDIFATGFITLMYNFAFYNLWNSIYKNNQIIGFTLTALIWYLAIAQILRSGGGRPVKDISQTIQDGTIINFMNKPLNYLWLQFSVQTGRNFVFMISSFILSGIMLFFLVGLPSVKIIFLPLIILTMLIGLVINFLLGFSIATAAFWVEDANPLHWIYDKTIFIIGGFLFPIELLPDVFMKIARFLPTSYFIYYPTKLLVNFEFNLFLETILGQIFYLVILISLANFLFKRGLKKLNINGG